MIRAALFDVGGTLDGPGRTWEARFTVFYRREGFTLPESELTAAFGHGTREAYADPQMCERSLRETVAFHVARQMEFLRLGRAVGAARIVDAFVDETEAALAASRTLLERLRPRVRLGVISNFYGNCERILTDAGITPLLDAVIDSGRVGVSKPDPGIFRLALTAVRAEARESLYVGDNFAKDMVPARSLGMKTAWVVSDEPAAERCAAVDCVLRRLEDVEAVIG